MTTFKYMGDPAHGGEGPETVALFGCTFPKGEPVSVDDKEAISKLENNGHFEKVDGRSLRKPKKTDGDEI